MLLLLLLFFVLLLLVLLLLLLFLLLLSSCVVMSVCCCAFVLSCCAVVLLFSGVPVLLLLQKCSPECTIEFLRARGPSPVAAPFAVALPLAAACCCEFDSQRIRLRMYTTRKVYDSAGIRLGMYTATATTITIVTNTIAGCDVVVVVYCH